MTSSTPQQTILRPCHSFGSKHWDLTTRGLSSVPGQDVWWTKWHKDMCSAKYFRFP